MVDYQIAARIERLPVSGWHLRIGLIIGSGWFFDAFNALSIAYVLPALVALWHLHHAEIGLLISIGYVGQIIGSLFFGWWAERIGRVPCALYTLLIFSIMSFCCAFAWSLPSMMIMRFIQGIGLGGEIPIMATYINEFANSQKRGRFSLAYQLLFPVGIVTVGFVGRWVVPSYGWRWMFIIGALPTLLAIPLRYVLPESPRWLARIGRGEEADRIVTRIENIISRNGARPLPAIPQLAPVPVRAKAPIGHLFKGIYKRRTISVWVIWFTTFLVSYGLQVWLPSIYRTVYHLSLQQSLNFAALMTIPTLLGTILVTLLIDRTGRRPWMTYALLLAGVLLLGLSFRPYVDPYWVLVIAAIAIGADNSVSQAVSTYTAEIYPTELRAMGCGMGNAWLRLSAVVGPLLIGLILPSGGIRAVFLLFGVAAVTGGITCRLFGTETRGKTLEELSPSLATEK